MPSLELSGSREDEAFGHDVVNVGDANGDGRSDLLILATNRMGTLEARLHLGSDSGLELSPLQTLTESISTEPRSIVGLGDCNRDGYADLAMIVAPEDVRVLFGSPTGFSLPGVAIRLATSHAAGALAASDTNGDGYSDLIVEGGQPSPGGGYLDLFLGSPSGVRPMSSARANYAADGERLAIVEALGDVNGDGFGDYSTVRSMGSQHEVLVFFGSATRPATTPDFSTLAAPYGAHRVSGAGDIDGDGYDDVVISNPSANSPPGGSSVGIYWGGASMLDERRSVWLTYTAPLIGWTAQGIGDATNDGRAEFVVSDHTATVGGRSSTGRVLVFDGTPAPSTSTGYASLVGTDDDEAFGQTIPRL